jgi:hypothetical protein
LTQCIVFEFQLRGKPLFWKGFSLLESDNIKIVLYSFDIPLAPGRFLGSAAKISPPRGNLRRFEAQIVRQGGKNAPLKQLS